MEVSTFQDFEMIVAALAKLEVDKTFELTRGSHKQTIWMDVYHTFRDGDHTDMLGLKLEIYSGKISHDYIYFGRKRKKSMGLLQIVKIFSDKEILMLGHIPVLASDGGYRSNRDEVLKASSLDFYEKVLTAAKLYF